MIKILENICHFLLFIILFINFSHYFFKTIYFKLNNKNLKKLLNKIFPVISKYSYKLLLAGVMPLLIVTLIPFIYRSLRNLLSMSLIILYLALIIDFRNISISFDYSLKKTCSYLILIFLIIKIII